MSVIVLLTLKTKPDAYDEFGTILENILVCLLYTSPSPRD